MAQKLVFETCNLASFNGKLNSLNVRAYFWDRLGSVWDKEFSSALAGAELNKDTLEKVV